MDCRCGVRVREEREGTRAKSMGVEKSKESHKATLREDGRDVY